MIRFRNCRVMGRSKRCSILFLLLCTTSGMVFFMYGQVRTIVERERLKGAAVVGRLMTFRRTDRWGMGNEMFALASTLGINAMQNNTWTICFDRDVLIRQVFDLQQVSNLTAVYRCAIVGSPVDFTLAVALYTSIWRRAIQPY